MISKAVAAKNEALIRDKAGLSLKISFVIGLAASAGLSIIMKETNMMLFKDDALSSTLSLLAGAIFFSSIGMTAAGILQGIGRARSAARYAGIGLLLKGLLNMMLIPMIGINGAAIATVVGFATVAVLTGGAVHKRVGLRQYSFYIGRAVAAVGVMSAAVILVHFFVPSDISRSLASLSSLAGAVVGVIIFGLSLTLLRVFTDKELMQFPKGEKITRFQNRLWKGA